MRRTNRPAGEACRMQGVCDFRRDRQPPRQLVGCQTPNFLADRRRFAASLNASKKNSSRSSFATVALRVQHLFVPFPVLRQPRVMPGSAGLFPKQAGHLAQVFFFLQATLHPRAMLPVRPGRITGCLECIRPLELSLMQQGPISETNRRAPRHPRHLERLLDPADDMPCSSFEAGG